MVMPSAAAFFFRMVQYGAACSVVPIFTVTFLVPEACDDPVPARLTATSTIATTTATIATPMPTNQPVFDFLGFSGSAGDGEPVGGVASDMAVPLSRGGGNVIPALVRRSIQIRSRPREGQNAFRNVTPAVQPAAEIPSWAGAGRRVG